MEVEWKEAYLNSSAPVLYIIQSKYSIGYHYSVQVFQPLDSMFSIVTGHDISIKNFTFNQ